jgi:hypothetical protein
MVEAELHQAKIANKVTGDAGMECGSCSYANPAGSNFCANCGNGLGHYCISCKGAIPLDARFCNHCGVEQSAPSHGPVEALKRGQSLSLQGALDSLEATLIETATKVADGNLSRAAELPNSSHDPLFPHSSEVLKVESWCTGKGANMPDRAEILTTVCQLIAQGEHDGAKAKLLTDYPCAALSTRRKNWPLKRVVAVFLRDGYTDRYSGARLVFPGTLLALSILLQDAFPYQRNWKQSATHPAFWELYPTLDHLVPVARGGADDESNVVTTSMLRNSGEIELAA